MRIASSAKSVVALLIVAAGVARAFLWQGSLLESLGSGISTLVILLLPLLLVVGGVALLNRFIGRPPHQQRMGKVTGWLFAVVGAMILSTVLFMVAVKGLNHWKFVVAQHYVAKAMPTLELIKTQRGSYPLILPQAQLGRLPANLSFSSYGTDYGFLYFDEDGEGILTFGSSDKTWNYEAP